MECSTQCLSCRLAACITSSTVITVWPLTPLLALTSPSQLSISRGRPKEAVWAAGRENAKAKLPMTSRERQNYAWRLTVMDSYSKSMIASAACISDGQVGIMRRVRKALGDNAGTCRSWWEALSTARGQERFEMDEDAREVWKQEQAESYAERMAKACGRKLPNQPEIAALALERYFGRRVEELVNELLDLRVGRLLGAASRGQRTLSRPCIPRVCILHKGRWP